MNRRFVIFTLLAILFTITACKKQLQTSGNANDSTAITGGAEGLAANGNMPNTAAEIYAKKQVPVICYHRIENGRNDEYTVTPAAFEAHMKALADSGYHSINPEQYYNYLVYNKELPEKPVMISFDDSRVEHFTIGAPVMEKYGFRGVFFIMTITYNKKNYMTTEQIAALSASGHSVGLHSWDHTQATKYGNDSILKENIIEPRKKLEGIIGMPVDYFAYPYGLTDAKTTKLMNDYFKISFILSTKQDSIYPLQTVRRMIAPEWSPKSLLHAMNKTFSRR